MLPERHVLRLRAAGRRTRQIVVGAGIVASGEHAVGGQHAFGQLTMNARNFGWRAPSECQRPGAFVRFAPLHAERLVWMVSGLGILGSPSARGWPAL